MAKETKKRLTPPKKLPKKTIARVAGLRSRSGVDGMEHPEGSEAAVLDRIWSVVMDRRQADPGASHSARLLARGTVKVAQKFGEEAVECVIEAVAGHKTALIGESADVLYHLMVMWVNAGLRPDEVWTELHRREGMSGIAEKAARKQSLTGFPTKKIP
jgi:phosphoribosyl-ATP pyrophosphohydrolase